MGAVRRHGVRHFAIDYDAQVTSTNGQVDTVATAPGILNTGAALEQVWYLLMVFEEQADALSSLFNNG